MDTFRKPFELSKYDKSLFKNLGIDHTKLTQEQINTILIPSHAPENYMCDGEITQGEARRYWVKQLSDCGLTTQLIAKALKLVQ